jgi:hypothetical protein
MNWLGQKGTETEDGVRGVGRDGQRSFAWGFKVRGFVASNIG